MNLSFNIFNILIFSGVIQGFIFGLVVLTSKAFKSNANKYLALTIIALSLNNLYYWSVDIGLNKQFEEINLLYLPWHLFFPATFYTYVCECTKNKIKKHVLIILLTPFFVSSILHIMINIFYYSIQNDTCFNVKIFYLLEEYVAFIYAILIGILSFLRLKKVKNKNTKFNTKWLYILLRVGLILCIVWVIIYSLAISFNIGGMKLYYPIWMGISILFYWIGYRGLYQFKLAKDRKAVGLLLNEISKKKNKEYSFRTDYYTQENPIFKRLKKLITEEHIYREQGLTLYSLAKRLETNTSTLSRLVNQVSEKKFVDFINSYRIEDAKVLLKDHKFIKYKIAAIAYEVGFNTDDNFYSTFKKYTGLTPGKYREIYFKNREK